MTTAETIKDAKSERLRLTYDEAKERGLLETDSVKARILGMDYNEAVVSGILDAVEIADEENERRRPAWMMAIGI